MARLGKRRAEVVAQASLSCPCGAIHLLAPYMERPRNMRAAQGGRPYGVPRSRSSLS